MEGMLSHIRIKAKLFKICLVFDLAFYFSLTNLLISGVIMAMSVQEAKRVLGIKSEYPTRDEIKRAFIVYRKKIGDVYGWHSEEFNKFKEARHVLMNYCNKMEARKNIKEAKRPHGPPEVPVEKSTEDITALARRGQGVILKNETAPAKKESERVKVSVRRKRWDYSGRGEPTELARRPPGGLARRPPDSGDDSGRGGRVRPPKIPYLSKRLSGHVNIAVLFLIFMVIGIILSVTIGSVLFLLALLCWAVYSIIPPPVDVIEKEIERVTKRFDKERRKLDDEMERARTRYERDRVRYKIEELQRERDAALKIEEIKARLKKSGHQIGTETGLAFVRELFKIMGLVFFSLAFILSTFPFATPVGLIIALVAYMMLGGTTYGVPEKEEEEE